MARTLFLFLFSDRVDTYINAIAYSYDNLEIESVRLVHVKGTKTGLTDTQAISVFNQIWNRLEKLASSTTEIYKRINERLLDRQLIPITYSNLKNSLEQSIKKQGGSRNCVIDITSASKVPSIDVFTVCLALGIKSIYTFELIIKYDSKNPDKFLYHAMCENDYSYTCLSNTEPVRASQSALLRKSAFLWYMGAISLIVMVLSLYILVAIGPNSTFVQGLNLMAAVVGLLSPALALVEQRRKS
ncbi:hypothetical protein [Anabaena sp. CCY 0017]|uniref:hypothetical protein n=1 Tax=Anabaena sp. CCY 0017 TaxID=3103866 RepID=UPI0039C63087